MSSATDKPRARRFQPARLPRPIQLTERDVAVLEALARCRFLSAEQLRRLVFDCGASRVRRRLRELFDHRLIDRISIVSRPQRDLPPFVYRLTGRGAAVLNEQRSLAPPVRASTLAPQTLRHQLVLNDFYITLMEACRGTACRLRGWRDEQGLKVGTGRGHAEQVRHRSLERPTPFLPDAFFELQLSSGSSFAFFVEIDLATHSHRTWRRRAALYAAYADPEIGLFHRRFGRQCFRLAIVTTRDFRRRSRCANILSTIEQTVGPSELFLATTVDELGPTSILGRIWRRPGSDERRALLDNPLVPKVRVAGTRRSAGHLPASEGGL